MAATRWLLYGSGIASRHVGAIDLTIVQDAGLFVGRNGTARDELKNEGQGDEDKRGKVFLHAGFITLKLN